MTHSLEQPAFQELADEADGTETAPMEVIDVNSGIVFDGWVVTLTKCRRGFIESIEANDHLRVGTIYPDGDTITLHVRVDK
jgi:hypothetical protein